MQKQSGFRRLRSSRTADTTEWNHMKNISSQVHIGVAASHPAAAVWLWLRRDRTSVACGGRSFTRPGGKCVHAAEILTRGDKS